MCYWERGKPKSGKFMMIKCLKCEIIEDNLLKLMIFVWCVVEQFHIPYN